MRIAALLVSLILLPASHLYAGPVVLLEFLNSDFTFGTVSPDQAGYDLDLLLLDGTPADLDLLGGGFEAVGAVFDHQTLVTNGTGDVIGSEYFYTGGTFSLSMTVDKDGTLFNGSFVAPILTLVVTAGEHDADAAWATYLLGPGLFDKSIADALGIGRRTSGGQGFSQLTLTDNGNRVGVAGDHTVPERQAWDGATHVTLNVPEPAMLALLVTAGALSIRRRPRR
jgi:hypothetical protein